MPKDTKLKLTLTIGTGPTGPLPFPEPWASRPTYRFGQQLEQLGNFRGCEIIRIRIAMGPPVPTTTGIDFGLLFGRFSVA